MRPDDLILVCSCTSLDHSIRFSKDRDSLEWYVDVMLSPERSFWKRLKSALAYLFNGRTCRYGCSSEVLLKGDDIPRLKAWIAQACEVGDA